MSFDKCIMTCTHHYSIVQNSFTVLKIPCVLPICPSLSPTPGNHWYFKCLHSFAFSRVSYSWSHSVCSFFEYHLLLPLSMKIQLTIQLVDIQLTIKIRGGEKRNFIQAKLRIIIQVADSQKALRTFPPVRSLRHSRTFLRQRIVHQNDKLIFYIKFTKHT